MISNEQAQIFRKQQFACVVVNTLFCFRFQFHRRLLPQYLIVSRKSFSKSGSQADKQLEKHWFTGVKFTRLTSLVNAYMFPGPSAFQRPDRPTSAPSMGHGQRGSKCTPVPPDPRHCVRQSADCDKQMRISIKKRGFQSKTRIAILKMQISIKNADSTQKTQISIKKCGLRSKNADFNQTKTRISTTMRKGRKTRLEEPAQIKKPPRSKHCLVIG